MQVLIDGLIFQKESHGGIARIYRELLPRMCDLDPDLSVTLFLDGPIRQDLPAHPHIIVRRAPALKRTLRVSGAWRSLLYPFRRLASRSWNNARRLWMGSGQGVIWHSTYYTLPPAWEGPQIVTVYDMVHEHFPDLYSDPLDDIARQQKRRCVENADAVICISEATRRAVVELYGLEAGNNSKTRNFHVIPLACNRAFHRLESLPVLPEIPEKSFLLYVGNRAHYKNFCGLLDAYGQWGVCGHVSLVVVGAPWSVEEKRHLIKAGIAGRVHLLSKVDDEKLCNLYNRASAFVFPSMDEGFGIPLLEAMACGCPVVASRIPSTLEVAGEAPCYFDLARPESLVAALDQVTSEGRDSQRVSLGLKHVQAFSWERSAQQTLEVYREVCGA